MKQQKRYFAWTRVFTGIPVSRGYVRDRQTGKIIMACSHKHRTEPAAMKCAEKLLRAYLPAKGQDL